MRCGSGPEAGARQGAGRHLRLPRGPDPPSPIYREDASRIVVAARPRKPLRIVDTVRVAQVKACPRDSGCRAVLHLPRGRQTDSQQLRFRGRGEERVPLASHRVSRTRGADHGSSVRIRRKPAAAAPVSGDRGSCAGGASDLRGGTGCAQPAAADPERDTVGDIAARWGFCNASSFTVAYPREFGERPSESPELRAIGRRSNRNARQSETAARVE